MAVYVPLYVVAHCRVHSFDALSGLPDFPYDLFTSDEMSTVSLIFMHYRSFDFLFRLHPIDLELIELLINVAFVRRDGIQSSVDFLLDSPFRRQGFLLVYKSHGLQRCALSTQLCHLFFYRSRITKFLNLCLQLIGFPYTDTQRRFILFFLHLQGVGLLLYLVLYNLWIG